MGRLVFTDKAYAVHLNLLDGVGEWLPVSRPNGEGRYLNITSATHCIDEDLSEWQLTKETGERMWLIQPVFRIEKMPQTPIFKALEAFTANFLFTDRDDSGAELKLDDRDRFLLDARFQYASLLADEAQWEQSERQFRRVSKLDPDYDGVQDRLAHVLLAWGQELKKSGQPSLASEKLGQAVALFPTNVDFRNRWVSVLMQTEQLEAAAEQLQQVVRLQPNSAPAHGNLGAVLAKMRRFKAAEASLLRAFEIDANYEPAKRNLSALADRREPTKNSDP